MPKKPPWHSVKEPRHRNSIEKENLRQGDGGKPLCKECEGLNRQGK